MAERKSIAVAMKELYDGFVKLQNNDEETRSIRLEVERVNPNDSNVDIESYKQKSLLFENEILRLRKIIADGEAKLSEVNSELASIDASFSSIDVNNETQKMWDNAAPKINALRNKANADITLAENDRNKNLNTAKSEFEQKLSQHKAKPVNFKYDEYSEKALTFYTEFVGIDKEQSEIIKRENDKITKEKATNSSRTTALSKQRDDTTAKYDQRLNSLQLQINAIYSKYSNEIEAKRNAVQSVETDRNDEIGNAERTRNNIYASYADQIARFQSQYKQTDKDFSKQIRQAEKEQRATTRLNTSRASSLNKINSEITKCVNKRDAELTKQDSAIETLRQKYAKQIAPLQRSLENVLSKQNAEIAPIKDDLNSLQIERDKEVERINHEINTLNNDLSKFISTCMSTIGQVEQTARNKHQDLLTRMTKFAMTNTKELERFTESALTAFEILDEQKLQWEDAVKKAATFRLPFQFKKKTAEIESRIGATDYSGLVNIVKDSEKLLKPSSFPGIMLVGGIAVGLAIVLAAIIILAVKNTTLGVIVPIVELISVVLIYFKVTSGYVTTTLTYNLLAEKYKELPAIRDHARLQTENLEVSRLKELGQELYKRIVESDSVLKQLETEYSNVKIRIEREYSNKRDKIESNYDKDKNDLESAVSDEIKILHNKAEKENSSFNKRRNDLASSINVISETLSDNKDRISDNIVSKSDLDAKIAKLEAFISYRNEYSTLQNAVKEDIKNSGEQENDVSFPDPLHFFGGKYSDTINYITKFDHGFNSSVLLYDSFESGTIVQSIENFMQTFLFGVLNATDEGLVKEQYIIDVTSGSQRFDGARYKESGIYVVDEKSLEKVISKLQKDCQTCRDSLDEYAVSDFGELNQKLKEKRKHPLPCSILHIIVPKRDQVDNASKMLSSTFKALIRNDDDKNGLIILFYVSKDEWYAPDVISDEKKKDEDIIFFIKKLGNLKTNEVFVINKQNATLSVDVQY